MKIDAKKLLSLIIGVLLVFEMLPAGVFPSSMSAAADTISNDSLYAKIGDLGQIEELIIGTTR